MLSVYIQFILAKLTIEVNDKNVYLTTLSLFNLNKLVEIGSLLIS